MYSGLMYTHLVIIAKQPCWDLFFVMMISWLYIIPYKKKRECKEYVCTRSMYVYMYVQQLTFVLNFYLYRKKHAIYAKKN